METRDEARKELETHDLWEDVPEEKRETLVTWLFEGEGRKLYLDTVNLKDTPAARKAIEAYVDAAFDEFAWVTFGEMECSYCERIVKHRRPPPANDDLGWKRVASEHSKKCVATRAGTIAAPKKAKKTKALAAPVAIAPQAPTFKLELA